MANNSKYIRSGIKKSLGRPTKVRLRSDSMERLEKYLGDKISAYKRSVGTNYVSEIASRIDINFKRLITNAITGPQFSTGDLINSTKVKYSIGKDNRPFGFRITISNSSPDFKFFEYGTGIIGEQSPENPFMPDTWEFDINGHGDKGWRFPARDPSTGKKVYYKTLGQAAACTLPDLYDLIQRDIPKDIAKKVKIYPPQNNY